MELNILKKNVLILFCISLMTACATYAGIVGSKKNYDQLCTSPIKLRVDGRDHRAYPVVSVEAQVSLDLVAVLKVQFAHRLGNDYVLALVPGYDTVEKVERYVRMINEASLAGGVIIDVDESDATRMTHRFEGRSEFTHKALFIVKALR